MRSISRLAALGTDEMSEMENSQQTLASIRSSAIRWRHGDLVVFVMFSQIAFRERRLAGRQGDGKRKFLSATAEIVVVTFPRPTAWISKIKGGHHDLSMTTFFSLLITNNRFNLLRYSVACLFLRVFFSLSLDPSVLGTQPNKTIKDIHYQPVFSSHINHT